MRRETKEEWMRRRQQEKRWLLENPVAVKYPKCRHRLDVYCGVCDKCCKLDEFLASGDQERMPWPPKGLPTPDVKSYMPSSWPYLVNEMRKFGAVPVHTQSTGYDGAPKKRDRNWRKNSTWRDEQRAHLLRLTKG